jgi:Zinc metalloprotease (elastase)
MKKLITTFAFLCCTVAMAKSPAADSKIRIHDQDPNGVPTFVSGELGSLGAGAKEQASKAFLKAQKDLLHMTGNEDFDVLSSKTDELGQTHVKFQEKYKGLPVVGAEYIVHSDASGNVVAMNGRFLAADDTKLPRAVAISSTMAISIAAEQLGADMFSLVDSPSLTYVVNGKSQGFLAWTAKISFKDADGPELVQIYADAGNRGDLVMWSSLYQRLKSRKVYTCSNGTTIPGTLLWSEGGTATSDTTAQAAYNYSGNVYDYYKTIFNRDSYDNAGSTIISSVHYSSSYNNAYWNGSQMVYGDGDGVQFAPLAKALDVDAHELTHAVTERTAALAYSNESGALNEATSDIMGNSVEAWAKNGGTPNSNTWMVGEDIYTPGTAGDALRYMNNPTQDGSSKDYYPTRYTGTSDNGGVHSNSGIANLAYYLMVMGGTHPRSATTVVVPALSATSSTSLDMGQRIWYRALTTYWTSSPGFAGARTGTVQAATDLYGAAAANSVTKAWDCVGAPGGSTGGGGGTTTLSNGVAVSSISGATGSWTYYKITVPTGQSQLQIVMSGGTGDADLYVKLGAQPSSTVYDYRPYLTGNNETVTVTNPGSGDWYIGINGYAAYSGVTLKATYTGSAPPPPPPTCTTYSGSLSGTGAVQYQPNGTYYQSTTSGTHTAKLTGPASGADFDLYLLKWNGSAWVQVAASESATANESISYSGTAGYYEWEVSSYSGSGSYTLCINHPN